MKELRKILFQMMHERITDYENHYNNIFEKFLEFLKNNNYKITEEVKQHTKAILKENERFIRILLSELVLKLQVYNIDRKTVEKVKKRIWNMKYPDGLSLSERLWKNTKEAEKEFYKVLKQQIALGKSFVAIAYEIQRHMEKLSGTQFTQLTKEEIKLIEKLRSTAKAMIKGEISKEKFDKVLYGYKKYIEKRKESPYGVKNAHLKLLTDLTKSVENLSEKAVDDAVKWYMYDKQLYNLKRIARTETANIFHKTVIASWEDNDFVIGYRWKLSPAHKIKDICDDYANAEFGLGKGVFPKDKVPQTVAHPHCTCIIEPVFKK